MIEIIPAVMPKSLRDLADHAERVMGLASTIQIDVMDGHFIQSRTWPYNRHDEFFEEILREENALPLWEEFDYEIDLMVQHPEQEAETWISAGAKRVIAHVENVTDMKKFLGLANEFVEVGLAIGVDTPVEKILPYLASLDCVQCMGISKIGYQGQPFDPRVLEQIKKIHAADPELTISVDGGVSFETAPELIAAGANVLVSGSVVFGSDNPADAIHRLAQS